MLILENIRAFCGAALPWVVMGIAIAVLAAWGISRQKQGKNAEDNYGVEGMCLGMSFGAFLGAVFDSVGLSLSLGMLVGLAIGCCIRKKPPQSK